MQKFNSHSHTCRCGYADLEMKEEEYKKEYRNGVSKDSIDRLLLRKT